MLVSAFLTKLNTRANEAKPDRFLTGDELLGLVNDAEFFIAGEVGYNTKTQNISIGDSVSSLSANQYWFDLPSDWLRTGDEPQLMHGDSLNVRVFTETLDNWYSRQYRPDLSLYNISNLTSSDSILVLYTRYPKGNRKIFTRWDSGRRTAGKSGFIWSMWPNFGTTDKAQLSYCAAPTDHLTTGESVFAPDIYRESMLDYCLAVIKGKAEEYQIAQNFEAKATGKAQIARNRIDPDNNRPRRFISGTEARGSNWHPWT